MDKRTNYIYAGSQMIARVDENGTPTYQHTDLLGSPVTGTDSTGAVTWRERYTPYGEKLLKPAANNNHASFTGHIDDSATGLTYMQARYYDPNIGRFLSIDPLDFTGSGSDPKYFNRYAYTFNDPINGIDPDGKQVVQDETLKITTSVGVSGKGGYGAATEDASVGGSVSLGLDVLVELGVGIPGKDRGLPLFFPTLPFGVVTIDAVGLAGSTVKPDSFSGAHLDTDILEVGVSLGDINDRGGEATTIEGDLTTVGFEISTPGELAGSTAKLDFLGQGFGVSTSTTITETQEIRFNEMWDYYE